MPSDIPGSFENKFLNNGDTLRFIIAIFRNILFLALMCVSISVHASGPEAISIDDITIDTDDIGKYERLLKGVPMSIDPEMMKKAKQAIPGDINDRVEREKSQLIEKEFYGIDAADGVSRQNQMQVGKALHETAILEEDERIYIFVSSSVSKETLRNYARDLDNLGEPRISIIMRGFVGGMTKVRPTLEFLRGVLSKEENCNSEKCESYRAQMLIDPLLFRRYGIDSVPAVVYVRGARATDSTVSEGVKEGVETKEHYVLYGDAALEGALEIIGREAWSQSLDCLVLRLRRGVGYERYCK